MSLANRRRIAASISVAALAATGIYATSAGTASAAVSTTVSTAKTPVVESTPVVSGLYQSAYSKRNDLVWTASAVGRPPVTVSQITAIDPDTLEVVTTIAPPVTDPATGAVEAVYGIDVDDETNTVWVTLTRNNGVAVYDQRTGEHLATVPNISHAREITVDEKRDLVWVTAVNSGDIVAIDQNTYAEVERIHVEGSRPTGLALHDRSGTVYVADLATAQLIEIKPGSDSIKTYPAGEGAIGVAVSTNGKYAYTANQTAGTLSTINLRTGEETEAPAGAGALSVEDDPRTGDLWVANRTDSNVTVIDDKTLEITHTIPTSTNPNHVNFGKGRAWVLDKANDGPDEESNLYRISLR